MVCMKQHLLVTTTSDLSLDYFRPFCDVILLDREYPHNGKNVDDRKSVYVRSHFSRPRTMPQNFKREIDGIGQRAEELQIPIVDTMGTVHEIVTFEDKWHQFQMFAKYMPETRLATEVFSDNDSVIFKKRISSQGTGIAWHYEDITGDVNGWVCQRTLDIREELRVYVVRGEVIEVAAVRQSKTIDQKIKVVGIRKLTEQERQFAASVCQVCIQLDFVGLDIAVTSGGLRLIEVNRSPDFASFAKKSGMNLAGLLYDRDCK